MSMQVFLLPDLGEGLTEAEIVEWKVKPGDTVTIDQVVVEVETAKASVEVPCPFEGVVGELHAAEGTSLAVGAPLISITGGAVADTPAAHERYREEERAGSGNVLIGYGTGHGPTGRRRRSAAPPQVGAAAPQVSGSSTQARKGAEPAERPANRAAHMHRRCSHLSFGAWRCRVASI